MDRNQIRNTNALINIDNTEKEVVIDFLRDVLKGADTLIDVYGKEKFMEKIKNVDESQVI